MTSTNLSTNLWWRRSLTYLLWGAILGFFSLVVAVAWSATPFAQSLAAIAFCCAVAHAIYGYGLRDALALLLFCFLVTFTVENIGVVTGLPFGHYHFEVGASLPHLGVIPLVVGVLWFGMGYFSWIVAGTLLDDADARLTEPRNVVVLPLLAAFVMTQWDFVMDAPSSTISKGWIWHDGGADFGVPLSNYLGWLLTSWLFFQAFALYLARRASALARARTRSRQFRLIAILFYLSAGLTHVTPWLLGHEGNVVDVAGHAWPAADLREHTVAAMLFTMCFTAVLAMVRLARAPREHEQGRAAGAAGMDLESRHDDPGYGTVRH